VKFLFNPVGTPPDKVTTFKFDTLLQRLNIVKRIEGGVGHSRMVHTSFKAPVIGITGRDMCTLSTDMYLTPLQALENGFGEGCEVFAQCSSDASTEIPAQKNYVRGIVHVHGVFVSTRPHSDNLDLDMVLSMDPCGWVPSKAVDAASQAQIEKLVLMRKCITEFVDDDTPLPDVNRTAQQSNTAQSTPQALTSPSTPMHPNVEKVLKLFRSPDWSVNTEKNGVRFSDKPSPYCGKKSMSVLKLIQVHSSKRS
jgi:hypothetical protein